VEDGEATLSGKVESEVQKDLAEQVALSIEGIDAVDNRIEVAGESAEGNPPGLVQRLEDASLAATVKSKLLWNSNTRGLDIQVKSETGNITLSGHAQTPAAKELAGPAGGQYRWCARGVQPPQHQHRRQHQQRSADLPRRGAREYQRRLDHQQGQGQLPSIAATWMR
jgi:hypothetical protein